MKNEGLNVGVVTLEVLQPTFACLVKRAQGSIVPAARPQAASLAPLHKDYVIAEARFHGRISHLPDLQCNGHEP